MNTMVKLLNRVDVEWKELGKISENLDSMRKPIASGLREAGEIPYYGASGVVDYVKEYIFNGDFLLVSEDGANLIARNTPIAFSISGKNWVNNHAHVLNFNTYVERRFVEFFLNSIDLTPYISGAAQPKLNQRNLNSIKIPIPHPENSEKSLKIQAEIVHILDNFTELTAELTVELIARKKQYSYYRDQLLTFEECEVEWKTLGEVAEKIYSGGTPKTGVAEYWGNGTIPWMASGEVNLKTVYKTKKYISEAGLKNSSAKFVPKNSVVIALAGQGKTRGKVARTRIDLTTNQSLASITFNDSNINSDYVFHFLKTQYENLRQISSGGGTRGGLNLKMISNYKLPIPSLAEQERIVTILNKFDTLTNSISEGLPREIELRQKQYEYYRDLLLNFPKTQKATPDA
ncbi:MAG: restriction endonuclease subunit S [Sulfurimonas sp.]|nr:restriction endonuclease subunit S [Sulfurimonas sp.]